MQHTDTMTLGANTPDTASQADRYQRFRRIIVAYPLGVFALSGAANLAFGVRPYAAAAPAQPVIVALAIAGVLLLLNHSWLMTVTELTRLRFGLHTTPEQWAEAGERPETTSPEGVVELARHHATHRNATENTVLFALLALVFVLGTPTPALAYLWLAGFGVSRLGHAYGYLRGDDNIRGLFMTTTLMSLYGMASYVVLSLLVP